MYNIDFVPEHTKVLSSDKHIKTYVHPTRMTIIALLAKEKRTISSIAKQLGVHPANITHHFKLLEKERLIKLVEKRDIGKNIEKYYRAIAYNFEVRLAEEQPSNKAALALSILRDNLSVAMKTLKGGDDRDVIGVLGTARIQPEDIQKFEKKLLKLVKEFRAHDSEFGDTYSLNISLYPNDTPAEFTREIIIKDDK